MRIAQIKALEILDSRGNPTVEAQVTLSDGSVGRAAVPSGASTGSHEVLELRDSDPKRYMGQGVLRALHNIEYQIAPLLIAESDLDQKSLDQAMLDLDGTPNKSNLGANAILAVSLAYAWAASNSLGQPLYQYINSLYGENREVKLPRPMFNIMNGGRHANWATDIQEFMIIPVKYTSFAEALRMGVEVFHTLEKILKDKGLSTNVGNEGGFAPAVDSNEAALDLILQAIQTAGYTPGEDIAMGMDVAASEFLIENKPGEEDDAYDLKKDKRQLPVEEWLEMIGSWIYKYPIISIEDPVAEDSWHAWHTFLQTQNHKLEQVVGDDLLVTNVDRIKKAIEEKACNALLVKPNQIGTLTETLAAMQLATDAGWNCIVSHRSGETEDVTISHIAVGTGCGQIKSGAPSRSERTAKFNELLRIEKSWKG
jgi:enolase